MNITEIETDSIRKFLLHELDEASSQDIEERFFIDPEFQEWVLIVEEEIFEDYILDNLPAAQRGRVEQYLFSSPEQRKKLNSMLNMVNYIKQTPEYNSAAAKANSVEGISVNKSVESLSQKISAEKTDSWLNGFWLRLATVALVLMIFGLGIYLVRQNMFPSSEKRALSKDQMERIEKINREYTESADNTLQVKLEPMVRGSQNRTNQIMLSPEKKIVELDIPITSGSYKSYQATFKEFDGINLATIKNLPVTTESQKSELKVRLPADVLKVGVYSIDISGETTDNRLESVKEFPFEVIK